MYINFIIHRDDGKYKTEPPLNMIRFQPFPIYISSEMIGFDGIL